MHSNRSCNKVKRPRSQRNRSEFATGRIRPIGLLIDGGIARVISRAIPAVDAAAAAALCASIGQAALAEPGEMTSPARGSFESEWFDRFGSDVFDSLFHRIGGVNQA